MWKDKLQHQLQNEEGISLLEALASILIAFAVILAIGSVFTNTVRSYAKSAADSVRVSDTMNVYWLLEELAQNATNVWLMDTTNNTLTTTTNTPGTVLVLNVSSLANIIPSNAPVYSAGRVGIAVVTIAGKPRLCLFPYTDALNYGWNPSNPAHASDYYPIDSTGTDFSGTTFTLSPPVTGSTIMMFTVNFNRNLSSVGTFRASEVAKSNLNKSLSVPYVIGSYSY